MCIYLDQSVTVNNHVPLPDGSQGVDVNQWLPWQLPEGTIVYVAQYVKGGQRHFSVHRHAPGPNDPHDHKKRKVHCRTGYSYLKVCGQLNGLHPRSKGDGPVPIILTGPDSFTTVIAGAAVEPASRVRFPRRRADRDDRRNAMR